MQDEEKQMLREIHDFLIGGLKEQGFIGETHGRIEKLEASVSTFKKVAVGTIIPLLALVGEKVGGLILK